MQNAENRTVTTDVGIKMPHVDSETTPYTIKNNMNKYFWWGLFNPATKQLETDSYNQFLVFRTRRAAREYVKFTRSKNWNPTIGRCALFLDNCSTNGAKTNIYHWDSTQQ